MHSTINSPLRRSFGDGGDAGAKGFPIRQFPRRPGLSCRLGRGEDTMAANSDGMKRIPHDP